MTKIVNALFWFFLAAFMLLGALVVLGQIAGTVFQQRDWVIALDGWPSTAAFVASTFCALAAFVMQYVHRGERKGGAAGGN